MIFLLAISEDTKANIAWGNQVRIIFTELKENTLEFKHKRSRILISKKNASMGALLWGILTLRLEEIVLLSELCGIPLEAEMDINGYPIQRSSQQQNARGAHEIKKPKQTNNKSDVNI